VIWLYLLPVTVGLIVAWPYIPQGAANLAGTPLSEGFTHSNFVKGRYLKPLGFVIYALMLANAVRDSKQPERWLIVLAASALLPTALVFGAVIIHGGDLTVVQTRREFLTPFGSHANEFGLLLMTACIPLLFVVADAKGAARFAWSVVLGLCAVGLTLTFSRGAWLGFLVAVVVFLIFQRKLQATLITIPIVLAALALAPQGVTDRLTTGFGEGTDSLVSGRGDHLSAGRVVSWRLLLPEVARSPIVGRGIGSTVWSSAVRDGLYKPIHPHSLYLAMAMDLGLVGLAALLWLQVKYLRAAWALARDDTLTTRMRAAFAGVAAMFVGVLVMGLTNNDFMPAPHQTYFWFFLGLLFAYWDRAQNLLRREAQTRAQVRVRGVGAGHGAFAGSAQRRGPSMASRTDS
jgi:O-antigen ligase